jgi:2-dehydropantoate 2-reductase
VEGLREEAMKVCIYGAGVIGGMLAAACARAGHEVSAIARGAHLDAIVRNGLTIVTPQDRTNYKLRASSDPAQLGPQDVVIVCTKTPSLADVARNLAPLLAAHTLVGFSVNGVLWFYPDMFPGGAPQGMKIDVSRIDQNGLLRKNIGAERSFGIIAWAGGEIEEPGVIHASRPGGKFAIGAATPAKASAIADLVKKLKLDGVDATFAPDLRVPMWQKYMSVVGNFAVCTLTGANIGQMQNNPPTQKIMLAMMAEAVAVAHAHGVPLDFDIEHHRANPAKTDHKPSMLQDLERGRVMEIDSAFLALQDIARGAGVATPVLDTLAPLLQLRAKVAGCDANA